MHCCCKHDSTEATRHSCQQEPSQNRRCPPPAGAWLHACLYGSLFEDKHWASLLAGALQHEPARTAGNKTFKDALMMAVDHPDMVKEAPGRMHTGHLQCLLHLLRSSCGMTAAQHARLSKLMLDDSPDSISNTLHQVGSDSCLLRRDQRA